MAHSGDLAKSGVIHMAPVDPIPSGSSNINVGETERYVSAGAGALLTTLGLHRGGLSGVLLASLGGYLVYRGASGYCAISNAIGRNTADGKTETDVLEISKSVTINKPRSEVYAFWRRLSNLPQFMMHLESVTEQDATHSHWVASLDSESALGKVVPKIEWDAIIVEEDENHRLLWQSVPGATVDNSGEVRFVTAPGNRGTEVHATIKYRAPAGVVGEAAMKLLSPAFKAMVKEDIRRFKRLMETGEIPTNESPSGRKPETTNPALHELSPNTQAAQRHESAVL